MSFFVLHYILLPVANVVLCVPLDFFYLYIALHVQYYTGEDVSSLRFMDSAAGQQDWKLR